VPFSPLTYPNPTVRWKTETTVGPPFLFVPLPPLPPPPLPRHIVFLSPPLSFYLPPSSSLFRFVPFRRSFSLSLCQSVHSPLINPSLLLRYIAVSPRDVSLVYSRDKLVGAARRGAARRRDGSSVGGIIDLAWRYIPDGSLCAAICSSAHRTRPRET